MEVASGISEEEHWVDVSEVASEAVSVVAKEEGKAVFGSVLAKEAEKAAIGSVVESEAEKVAYLEGMAHLKEMANQLKKVVHEAESEEETVAERVHEKATETEVAKVVPRLHER